MGSLFNNEKKPLICVPITAGTNANLMTQLSDVIESEPDMIEWRADFFEQLYDTEAVLQVIEKIKRKTGIPLLFTIRSEKEGGEPVALNESEKVDLLVNICRNTAVDAVDYEVENDREFVENVRDAAKQNGVKLILSYHHFSKTPIDQELLKIGVKMEFFGADVAKIAVMPQSRNDVNRLLNVTMQLDDMLQIPVITMSMGELGAISRVIGYTYGSRLTFAVGVESSAPGQIPITKLRNAIEAVQAIASV